MQPLQIVLRRILILTDMTDTGSGEDAAQIAETIKYATDYCVYSTDSCIISFPSEVLYKGCYGWRR